MSKLFAKDYPLNIFKLNSVSEQPKKVGNFLLFDCIECPQNLALVFQAKIQNDGATADSKYPDKHSILDL